MALKQGLGRGRGTQEPACTQRLLASDDYGTLQVGTALAERQAGKPPLPPPPPQRLLTMEQPGTENSADANPPCSCRRMTWDNQSPRRGGGGEDVVFGSGSSRCDPVRGALELSEPADDQ